MPSQIKLASPQNGVGKVTATSHLFLDPLTVNPGSEEGVRSILHKYIDEAGAS